MRRERLGSDFLFLVLAISLLAFFMASGPPRYSLENAVYSGPCEPYQRFGMVFFASEPIDERVVRALQPARTTTAHAVLSEFPGRQPSLAPGDWAGIYRKDGRQLFVLCSQHALSENKPLPMRGTWKQFAESWTYPKISIQEIAHDFGYEIGDLIAETRLTTAALSVDQTRVCVTSGCVSRLPEFTSRPPPSLIIPSFTRTRLWIVPPIPTISEIGVLSMVSKDQNYIPLDHGESMFTPACPRYEELTYDEEAWQLQRSLVDPVSIFTFTPGASTEEEAKQLVN